VLNELRMDYEYDYMLMFTQEYAKLQRFKPKDLIAGLQRGHQGLSGSDVA